MGKKDEDTPSYASDQNSVGFDAARTRAFTTSAANGVISPVGAGVRGRAGTDFNSSEITPNKMQIPSAPGSSARKDSSDPVSVSIQAVNSTTSRSRVYTTIDMISEDLE